MSLVKKEPYYVCDFCGEIINDYDGRYTIKKKYVDKVNCYEWIEKTRSLDMCQECMNDFKNYRWEKRHPTIIYRCFHCGGEVRWDADFDFQDYGLEGDGIIHECHCNDCGAQITYYVGEKEDSE